ncbi:gamma-glutamyltransferase family protein [Jiella pelagia]|uniref:Gamma-glutamyltransferase family protein n=1 Tax=Jiella pelagia TaxID=2986949 RepID=A0ABY7BZS1_9HYPH|nr:gamma-glutamyltransferase family protein [Jiella pelagia]WAP68912.1 gamma-glutamyltransferase family protein [Jiella pelagia]
MFDFYSGRRPSTYAGRAMIATSHPLSTAAGLEVLQAGGNAVDAGLAALAVQCVVDPLMTGIGGDCFALYAPAGSLPKALNGSGRTPAAASLEAILGTGLSGEIPQTSPHAVTIPGAVSAWCRLSADYGSMPLSAVFKRAIGYARDGYVVTPRVAMDWANNAALISQDENARAVFMAKGAPPLPGSRHAQPLLADRLAEIAESGAAGFYEGSTAKSMAAYLKSIGGLHTPEDFASAKDAAHWVEPISANYRGYDVYECPPNGQGLAALMILKILEGFDLKAMGAVDRIHIHAEATKIAYHHRDALIADPDHCPGIAETLLDEAAISAMRAAIDPSRSGRPALWDEPEHTDTIYLSVVDEAGNALSLINSLFHGFGSARLDPGTGLLFHSRGASFRLIEGHPNAIGPNKRPMHTIIPGMVAEAGKVVMPFGVMGGHYQAAGHAHLLVNLFDRQMSLQEAMDEPRSFAFGGELQIEPGINEAARKELAAKGHVLKLATSPIGGSQAIRIHAGCLEGGSESRKDGMALGF